jgi:phosphoribosylamine-glycine ligase
VALTFDDGWSVCVILASAGYPESSRSGDLITGLETTGNFRLYLRADLDHPFGPELGREPRRPAARH